MNKFINVITFTYIIFIDICNSVSINKEDITNTLKNIENEILGNNLNYTTTSTDTNKEFYEEISFYLLIGLITVFICVVLCVCLKCKNCCCCC